MKNSLSLLAAGAFLLLLPGIITLKKHTVQAPLPAFREQLTHTWDIRSFSIDGVEVKGSVIKTSTLELGDCPADTGHFRWTLHYKDDTRETQSGRYTLDENARRIDVENQRHEHFQFDLQLENDELQLTGTLDGERYVLKARRDWK